MSGADVRVVVLSYGGGGEATALLDSLVGEGVEPERILVVHNPSRVGEQPPPVLDGSEVLLATHNLGYAPAMNLGIERQLARDCEMVLVLTHDARLRSGSLAELVQTAAANPRFGALGPVLVLAGTEVPFSFGGVNRPDGGVEHRKSPPAAEGGIAPCDWIDGGTMLIRAEALASVGGFDQRFWSYAEDADLCLRIRRGGWGVGVVLASLADQEPGGSKRPGPWAYLRTRNGLAYARRAGGRSGLLRLLLKAVYGVGFEALRAAARLTHLRPGDPGEQWAVAVGSARGMVDYLRGRWGPPPSLPGASDMSNTRVAEDS